MKLALSKTGKDFLPGLVLYGLVSLPTSIFFVWMAFSMQTLKYAVATPLIVLVILFSPYGHLRNLYFFPLLEFNEHFMVVNQPFQKRSVYTLKRVTFVKQLFKSVIFIHNGWPVLHNLNRAIETEL